MKICSTSVTMREMQTSPTMRQILLYTHYGSYNKKKFVSFNQKTSVGKDVEKLERLCTAGGDVKWCSHSGNLYGGSSKN